MDNVFLVDIGGRFHRSYHKYVKTNFDILHEIKKSTIEALTVLRRRYYIHHIVIAEECSRSENWRLEFFPNYKANREKPNQPEDKIKADNEMRKIKLEFYQWCKNLGSINFLSVGEFGCEGDDVIASIVLNNHNKYNFFISSDDKDFQQLLKYQNVHQIAIGTSNYLVKEDYSDIRYHICIGDKVDGIPNIKYGYGDAKIRGLIERNELDEFIQTNNLQEAYNINQKLIDMTFIPKHLQENISKKFNDAINSKRCVDIIECSNFLDENGITEYDFKFFL